MDMPGTKRGGRKKDAVTMLLLEHGGRGVWGDVVWEGGREGGREGNEMKGNGKEMEGNGMKWKEMK